MDLSNHITVHARVRYVERCLGKPICKMAARAGVNANHDGEVWAWAVAEGLVDTAAVELALVTAPVIMACRLGATSVDLGNGCRAMIERGRVITILTKDRSRQLCKTHWATRDRRLQAKCSKDFKRRKEAAHDYA
jgi:hypothetical protein